MAPICIAAPADVVIDTSSTTMLCLAPVDLSTAAAATTTLLQGTKRKLNELYESMHAISRKHMRNIFGDAAYKWL
jgi:hypothetical protein